MRLLGSILLAMTLFISGCSLFEGESEVPSATQEAEAPTPVATPTLMSDPQSTPASGPAQSGQLNVWIANQFATANDPSGGVLLEEQFDSYRSANPELTINVVGKVASGTGGILDYLHLSS